MARCTAARIGLLALLVLGVVAQSSADASIEKAASDVLKALKKGSGSRSDATSCWKGTSLTCKASPKCAKSKCACCACPCDSAACLANSLKATYKMVEKTVNALKSPAEKRAAAPGLCAIATANARATKAVVSVYSQVKCPGYLALIKTLKAYQANYNKWCKGFSG